MRRIALFALLGLLGLAAPSRAGCLLPGCCPCCKPIPCPCPADCDCPCDNRLHLMICDKSEEYIAVLRSIGCTGPAGCGCDCGCGSNCCERIKAAEKLGDRFKADFCCNPAVLQTLLGALQCDPCWEVRRAAAWSIMLQDARTEDAVLALYIASKADHHYMVRARAAEALDILTRCRKCCYTELEKVGDAIVKELKAKKYKAGMECCCGIVAEAYAAGQAAYAKEAAEEAAKKAAEAWPVPPAAVPPAAVPPMPAVKP